jgi:hypothetical protein
MIVKRVLDDLIYMKTSRCKLNSNCILPIISDIEFDVDEINRLILWEDKLECEATYTIGVPIEGTKDLLVTTVYNQRITERMTAKEFFNLARLVKDGGEEEDD